MLYLETSAIPLRHVISIRRRVYFQTLITREDGELTKKVYETQKINPSKGDWIEHLKEDFQFIDENIDEKVAKEMTKLQYKTMIKKKIRQKVFENLKTVQQSHSKVKDIIYNTFKMQDYMNNHILTNHEISLLFALRSRSVRNVANNFGQEKNCPLGCQSQDKQEHWIACSKTLANQGTTLKYSDIYGDISEQTIIVKLFAQLEQEREELTAREAPGSPVAAITGPRPLGP